MLKIETASPDVTARRLYLRCRQATFPLARRAIAPLSGYDNLKNIKDEVRRTLLGLPGIDAAIKQHRSDMEKIEARIVDHTARHFASLSQIPDASFEAFAATRETERVGLGRIANHPNTGRANRNLENIRRITQGVNVKLLVFSCLLHDIGKVIQEVSHQIFSHQLLVDNPILEVLQLSGVDAAIVKKAVLHSHLLGNLFVGEYSPEYFSFALADPDMQVIISAGRFHEFVDIVTILTVCDITGFAGKAALPYNGRLESYFRTRERLPILAEGMARSHELGVSLAVERLAGIASGFDGSLDVFTDPDGNLGFYIGKILEAKGAAGISEGEWREFAENFSRVTDFPYASKFLGCMAWSNPSVWRATSRQDRIHPQFIRFLVRVTRGLNAAPFFPVEVEVRGPKTLAQLSDAEYCDVARRIHSGDFPESRVIVMPERKVLILTL